MIRAKATEPQAAAAPRGVAAADSAISVATAGMDTIAIGRRIRALRKERRVTLEALAAAVGRAPSQLSGIENGKREPKLSMLAEIARALDVHIDDLLAESPADPRTALEIELERIQRAPGFGSLGVPSVRVAPGLGDDALEAIVALHRVIDRLRRERIATPEEARRANTELRAEMRAQHNYFGEIEAVATEVLAAVGHTGGPLSQRSTAEVAARLGLALHYVPDLPHSTRSVIDLENGRVYLPTELTTGDSRTAVLQAVAGRILGHNEPRDYAEFLRQRVETNYLVAALLIPEQDACALLVPAKEARQLSIEDLRDAFAVSYETAAHRFTNLATEHLGLRVHFNKVHESGTFSKAYENDGVVYPTDGLGAIEGQVCCRNWTSRIVFGVEDRFNPFYQYTDTPTGTYWCTSRVRSSASGTFSVSVGCAFDDAKWFRGRETTSRGVSSCPDDACCQRPPAALRARWAQASWPVAKPHSSVLVALPQGVFPGVDATEVYEFLDAHSG